VLTLSACKTEAPPPPPPPKPVPVASAPPLPKPTPEEMAEIPLDAGKSMAPDAGPDSKLACAAGTVSWNKRDLRQTGIFCVRAATAKDPEPVKHGPAITFHRNGARHE